MPGVEPGSVSTSAEDSFTGLVSVYQNSAQTVFAVFFDLTSALVSELSGGPESSWFAVYRVLVLSVPRSYRPVA